MRSTLGKTFVLPKEYSSVDASERIPSNPQVMRRYINLNVSDSVTSLTAGADTAGPSPNNFSKLLMNNSFSNI